MKYEFTIIVFFLLSVFSIGSVFADVSNNEEFTKKIFNLANEENFEDAIKLIEIELENETFDHSKFYSTGFDLVREGYDILAIPILEDALDRDEVPLSYILGSLGFSYQMIEDHEKAIFYFEKGLDLKADDEFIW